MRLRKKTTNRMLKEQERKVTKRESGVEPKSIVVVCEIVSFFIFSFRSYVRLFLLPSFPFDRFHTATYFICFDMCVHALIVLNALTVSLTTCPNILLVLLIPTLVQISKRMPN